MIGRIPHDREPHVSEMYVLENVQFNVFHDHALHTSHSNYFTTGWLLPGVLCIEWLTV